MNKTTCLIIPKVLRNTYILNVVSLVRHSYQENRREIHFIQTICILSCMAIINFLQIHMYWSNHQDITSNLTQTYLLQKGKHFN